MGPAVGFAMRTRSANILGWAQTHGDPLEMPEFPLLRQPDAIA